MKLTTNLATFRESWATRWASAVRRGRAYIGRCCAAAAAPWCSAASARWAGLPINRIRQVEPWCSAASARWAGRAAGDGDSAHLVHTTASHMNTSSSHLVAASPWTTRMYYYCLLFRTPPPPRTVWLIKASAYRLIGCYRHSKHKKSLASLNVICCISPIYFRLRTAFVQKKLGFRVRASCGTSQPRIGH